MRLIDADKLWLTTEYTEDGKVHKYYEQFEVDDAPTIDPIKDMDVQLLSAIKVLKHFITEECKDIYTACIEVKKDGTRLMTDWGYFEEGLNEIEKWAMKDEEE